MTVYYRGIPKREKINQTPNSVIWVTDNPEYASEYGVVYELDIDDSNCASSLDVYDIAYEYGYTEDSEIIDDGTVTIANGDTVKTVIVNLKNISIGNHTIENVKCSVFMNTDAPTLLGQDVLSKIGNVLISYNKNCLIIQN